FGSHFTNLMRRLKRVCRFYNSSPCFILCSATIANPEELASRLIEEDVVLISNNGAPTARKYMILYNPPVVNPQLGIRASCLNEARRLSTLCLENELQTIVFTTSRLNVEVLTKYLKDRFDRNEIQSNRIAGYRGGYLPLLRRDIEKGLRDRSILGVVSTNALELGIDIGALEVSILAGYPGTIASTWQQSGRAGRRQDASLSILVSRSNPLDQFMVQNPDYLFGQPPEHGRINPDNLMILVSHIKCAAFELPFEPGETFGKEDLEEILSYLDEKGVLHKAEERFHWSAESYPANEISLRSVSNQNFVVVDNTDQKPQIIAEVDYSSAPFMIHEDAIYMLASQLYHVDQLDWDRKKAYVREVSVDYYTDAMDYTNVKVLDEFESAKREALLVEHGEVHVVSKVVGFKKIRFYTSENVGYGEVNIPENQIHTTAYWFTVPLHILRDLPYNRVELIDGLLGVGYLLHHVASIHLMCDLRDINHCIGDKSSRWFVKHIRGERRIYSVGDNSDVDPDTVDAFDPTIFIYDNYPGGIGFSPQLFDLHHTLLMEAMTALNQCICREGCPSCIGPTAEMGVLSKKVALDFFRLILRET
ncbi:MAG: Zn-binding domain-containing protein, partial [Thermodesulfobacteriota bacterium]|nr:Zn-binding domain-containing protein [Thermodesulfobacteriota bacterium]